MVDSINMLLSYDVYFFLLLLALTVSVRPEEPTERQYQNEQPSTERYSFFDLELFEVLTRTAASGENVALSPISVKLVLALMMEGSYGASSDEIRQALRLPEDQTKARKVINSWLRPFKEKQFDTSIELASQLFLSNASKVNPSFVSTVKEHFDAGIKSLDFSKNDKAADEINGWVKKATHGLIPGLVSPDQLGIDCEALLATAVYFKGLWKKPFEGERSYTRCFYKKEGECSRSMFMQTTDTVNYAYIPTLDAQVIELPYKDERFSMVIVLPKDHSKGLARDLVHEHLHRILDKLRPQEVYVQIPRFTIDYEQDLVSALRSVHISEVFSPNANLSGMIQHENKTLAVSNIIHSTKVIVNEQGTEAAAVTGALFVPLMGRQIPSFTADKPFYFFIRDSISDVILFVGRVSNPEVAEIEKTSIAEESNNEYDNSASANRKTELNSEMQSGPDPLIQTLGPVQNVAQKKKPYVPVKSGRPDPVSPEMQSGPDPLIQALGPVQNVVQKKKPYVPVKSGRPDPVSTQSPGLLVLKESHNTEEASDLDSSPLQYYPRPSPRPTAPPPVQRPPLNSKPAKKPEVSRPGIFSTRSLHGEDIQFQQDYFITFMKKISDHNAKMANNPKLRRSYYSDKIAFLP